MNNYDAALGLLPLPLHLLFLVAIFNFFLLLSSGWDAALTESACADSAFLLRSRLCFVYWAAMVSAARFFSRKRDTLTIRRRHVEPTGANRKQPFSEHFILTLWSFFFFFPKVTRMRFTYKPRRRVWHTVERQNESSCQACIRNKLNTTRTWNINALKPSIIHPCKEAARTYREHGGIKRGLFPPREQHGDLYLTTANNNGPPPQPRRL